jgi:hypothetical protein
MRETKGHRQLREIVCVAQCFLVITAAWVYVMYEKVAKYLRAQWFMYVVITALLVILLSKERIGPDLVSKDTVPPGAAVTEAATVNRPAADVTAPPADSDVAIVDDSAGQCSGGCGGGGGCFDMIRTRAPFREQQWHYVPSLGLHYLRLSTGWLISAAKPGTGGEVIYVPRFPRLKHLPGRTDLLRIEKPRGERIPNKTLQNVPPAPGGESAPNRTEDDTLPPLSEQQRQGTDTDGPAGFSWTDDLLPVPDEDA